MLEEQVLCCVHASECVAERHRDYILKQYRDRTRIKNDGKGDERNGSFVRSALSPLPSEVQQLREITFI